MEQHLYWYKGRITRIIDGDTVEAEVELGFYVKRRIRIRMLDVNAPEIFSGHDKEAGYLAKDKLAEMIPIGTEVFVHTVKDKLTFDRYVADIHLLDGTLIRP